MTGMPDKKKRNGYTPVMAGLALVLLAACQPTVRVEAPKEPITINLNIQADIRVKIEEQAKQDITKNDNIF